MCVEKCGLPLTRRKRARFQCAKYSDCGKASVRAMREARRANAVASCMSSMSSAAIERSTAHSMTSAASCFLAACRSSSAALSAHSLPCRSCQKASHSSAASNHNASLLLARLSMQRRCNSKARVNAAPSRRNRLAFSSAMQACATAWALCASNDISASAKCCQATCSPFSCSPASHWCAAWQAALAAALTDAEFIFLSALSCFILKEF